MDTNTEYMKCVSHELDALLRAFRVTFSSQDQSTERSTLV